MASEEIKQQQELLNAYRRTLFALLKQRAEISAGHVPAHIVNGIEESRDHIRQLKQNLRNMGKPADDQNYDEEPQRPQRAWTGRLSSGSANTGNSHNIGLYIGIAVLLVVLGAGGYALFSRLPHTPSVGATGNPTTQPPSPSSVSSVLPTAIPTIRPTVEPTATTGPTAEPAKAPTEVPAQPTATPPPPPTPVPPTITPQLFDRQKIEAEDADVIKGADITKSEPAASNNAWVNMGAHGKLTFKTRPLVAGQYKLEVHYDKYANGTLVYPYEGYQDLYVNNSTSPIQIYYTGTHDDSQPVIHFQDTSVPIVLEQGINTLTIVENVDKSVGGSPDYITLTLIN